MAPRRLSLQGALAIGRMQQVIANELRCSMVVAMGVAVRVAVEVAMGVAVVQVVVGAEVMMEQLVVKSPKMVV
jgi:hypothetical protein